MPSDPSAGLDGVWNGDEGQAEGQGVGLDKLEVMICQEILQCLVGGL